MNVEAVPRKLFAEMYWYELSSSFLVWGTHCEVWRSFVGTVCVLCYKCVRKARDLLGAGEVLGHTHDSFIDVNWFNNSMFVV